MFVFYYLGVVVMIVFILQGVAFLVLLERHYLGGSQCRVGPNKVGYSGVLQCLFDGFKLMKKEHVFLFSSSHFSFLFMPISSFMLMIFFWFTLPYFFVFMTFEYSGVFLFCLMGVSVYFIMLSGIFSGSKYSFIGGLRSSAQSYSYEIAFSIYLLIFLFFNKSISLYSSFCLFFFLFFLPFFCLVLVDLHRAPFDFSECESELVSGFNVDYSSTGFAFLFLGEYGNLLYFSFLASSLFFGGSFLFFYFMVCFIVFSRSAYPRFRFDMLMMMCWFIFLPIGFYFFGFLYVVFMM
uniref:NADH dehydrogenase subunit 1 n=1 Tax=Mansonella sp. 'DEUX' TaxID=1719275 RepID=UPI0025520373|nr:NADH dehydrogenase subunit 1 [Mansonella sp. 'DEUX']WGC93687.1 NADH dehydrogenase subunit 1 [Mansonella sp. 'DEUX']WGC93699.1 NADH dehydrogenase subunit 1 [Mansonella sp. 'DEUX']